DGTGDVCEAPEPFLCTLYACIETPRETAGGRIEAVQAIPGTEQLFYLTSDGVLVKGDGKDWELQHIPFSPVVAVHAVSETEAWLVTEDADLYVWDGTAWAFVADTGLSDPTSLARVSADLVV